MPKRIITWVLVADGAHARVLVNDGPGRGLKPALDREFAASHPRVRDIVSDRQGRRANRLAGGGGGRHTMDPKTGPQRVLEQDFAKDLARFLEKQAMNKRYQRLVLVAPPRTLGDLRAALPGHARAAVTAEVVKDLVRLDDAAIARHLSEVVL